MKTGCAGLQTLGEVKMQDVLEKLEKLSGKMQFNKLKF